MGVFIYISLYKGPEKSGLFFIKFIYYVYWTMEKTKQIYHFMGYKFSQTVKCNHNKILKEDVFIQSKWELPHLEYSIEELMRMEDSGDIITHFGHDVCSPFYCWNEAMEVIHKIELTPCNDGFPTIVLTGKYYSIDVDDKTFLVTKEITDNKLEILEELVYEFLNYYYTDVVKND